MTHHAYHSTVIDAWVRLISKWTSYLYKYMYYHTHDMIPICNSANRNDESSSHSLVITMIGIIISWKFLLSQCCMSLRKAAYGLDIIPCLYIFLL